MKIQITTAAGDRTAAVFLMLATALLASAAVAQDQANAPAALYPLHPPVSSAPSDFNMPWGPKLSLSGYGNSLGVLLFQPEGSHFPRLTGQHDGGAWLDPANFGSNAIAGSASQHGRQTVPPAFGLHMQEKSYHTRDDYSRRWFIMPTPNLVLQLTRGHLSNLDQLEAPKNVRRTTVSATYQANFESASWQNTFAWGRHSSNLAPDMTGYLAESSLRFAGAHTVFGRLERVRSEDFLPGNDLQDMFKLNKLTAGYYYDLPTGSSSKIGVGGMVSRYSVPSGAASAYGKNPTTLLLFVNMQLQ
jgi:hypothetical protein